MKTAMVTESIT